METHDKKYEKKMKFSKIISITLIIIMLLYIVLSSFEGIGNVSYAAGLTSIEEAEKLAPRYY